MVKFRPGKVLERYQQFKTREDGEYRFGKVILIAKHFFSKKLIPFDAESGERIVAMRIRDAEGSLMEVNVENILGWWWKDDLWLEEVKA